ncbi:hypothetical protein ACFRPV_36525 [Kitasatospora sp. NPDC056808]
MHTLDAVDTLAQRTGENVPPWLTVLVLAGCLVMVVVLLRHREE